jgi:hypothetical protein
LAVFLTAVGVGAAHRQSPSSQDAVVVATNPALPAAEVRSQTPPAAAPSASPPPPRPGPAPKPRGNPAPASPKSGRPAPQSGGAGASGSKASTAGPAAKREPVWEDPFDAGSPRPPVDL